MLKIKKSSDIYGFIHIGTLNGWKKILEDEMMEIHKSGLFRATNTIFVGIAGEKVPIPHGTKLAVHNPRIEHGENETIRFLHTKSKEFKNAKFWYIHTKGARWRVGTQEAINSQSWRKYMQFFIIEHWQNCVKSLETHDACGVEWTRSRWKGNYIFSGNFWWATSNYLSKIENPIINDRPFGHDRFKAEFFISLANPYVEVFHTLNYGGNLYGKFISPSQYHKNNKKSVFQNYGRSLPAFAFKLI